MAYSDTLISQKNSFMDMKGNIAAISQEIKQASDKVQRAADNITSCFLIDDSGADNKKLQRIADQLRNLESSFSTEMTDSINTEVNKLNDRITKQVALEKAEEKRKKEKEERKKKELEELKKKNKEKKS